MKKLAVTAILGLFLFAHSASFAFAQLLPENTGLNTTAQHGNLITGAGPADVDIGVFIGQRVIAPALSLMGVIGFALIVYAGVLWMTAMGDEKKVKKAKDIITAVVIGTVVISSAYVIINTVLVGLSPSVT